VAENEGLWKFAWTTNFTTSLNLVWKQFPVLAVGWAVDAVAAGGFRIATQLTGALNKPTIALARAVYPEFAKLAVTGHAEIRQAVGRACLIGGLAGLVALAFVVLLGKQALHLIGGDAYVFVYPVLIVLSLAAAFELSGVAIEPALVAIGRPGQVLLVRAFVAVLYVAILIWLVRIEGSMGAAIATAVTSLLLVTLLYAVFRKTVIKTAG
jgi:O-antigen/teichoic acid export membrane protein